MDWLMIDVFSNSNFSNFHPTDVEYVGLWALRALRALSRQTDVKTKQYAAWLSFNKFRPWLFTINLCDTPKYSQ
jgi:hypothetical protein